MADYDPETLAYIKEAKNRMANNHGLAIQRDPKEIMMENNRGIHDAANLAKRKKGMVHQNVSMPHLQQQPQAEYHEYKDEPANYTAMEEVPLETFDQQTDVSNSDEFDKMMAKMYREQPSMNNPSQSSTQQFESADIQEHVAESSFESPTVQANPVLLTVHKPPTTISVKNPPIVHGEFTPPKAYITAKPNTVNSPVQVDYDAFTEIAGLPSGGRCYAEKLKGQAFKLMDLMTLGDIDESNVTDILSDVIGRRIRGVNPEDILGCDEAYLLHWLRASSFPDQPIPMYPFDCPECHTKFENGEILSNIGLNFGSLDFNIDGNAEEIFSRYSENGCYTFHLPDGRQCDVYIRTRRHTMIADDYLSKYARSHKKPASNALELIVRTAVLIEIEGCETLQDKIEYLGNMPVAYAKTLMDELNKCTLNTIITANIICPHCRKEIHVPYPFRLDYYISSL